MAKGQRRDACLFLGLHRGFPTGMKTVVTIQRHKRKETLSSKERNKEEKGTCYTGLNS